MFLRQRSYGSEHHCPDEVGKVVLPEDLFEVREDDPFGFVEFDSDQFCALAVEVVETVVVDDFSHDLINDSMSSFVACFVYCARILFGHSPKDWFFLPLRRI